MSEPKPVPDPVGEKYKEILVSVHLMVSEEFVNLDDLDLDNEDIRRDIEAAIEMQLHEHDTDQVGHTRIDDRGYPWTDAFHGLWQGGFTAEARIEDHQEIDLENDHVLTLTEGEMNKVAALLEFEVMLIEDGSATWDPDDEDDAIAINEITAAHKKALKVLREMEKV